MSETLYRKYRPSSFADVTGQEHVKTTLQNQLAAGSVAHAYLFTGPRGVGKTTVARLLARAVNCEKLKKHEPCGKCAACVEISSGAAMDVIEVDAASHTKVEETRENIIAGVRFAPTKLARKVYIIDEVHMLSTASFNALLKTLEEPPAHAIFILATTEIHKVPATVLSRCQRFDFRRIPAGQMIERLARLSKEEGMDVDEGVLAEIARRSEGCARDAESLLGQILALGEKKIDAETASLVLPYSTALSAVEFLENLAANDAGAAIHRVNSLVEEGVDLPAFVDDAVAMLRALMLEGLGDAEALSGVYGGEALARAQALRPSVTPFFARRGIEELLAARRTMKYDRLPQMSLELAVLKLCEPADFPKQGVDSARPARVVQSSCRVILDEAKELPARMDPSSHALREGRGPQDDKRITPILEAKSVVLDTVPVVSLEDVQRKWPDVFELLKDSNAMLPMMVQAGEVSGIAGDEVEISFKYGLYAENVNKEQNRTLLEAAMARAIGRPLRIVAKHRANAQDIASALINEFGGGMA